MRYAFFGEPSRVKCDETRPVECVGVRGRRRRGSSWLPKVTGCRYIEVVTIQAQPDVVVESTIETDEGDHERFTHLVLEGYTPKDGEFVALGTPWSTAWSTRRP